jgi:hypothetical protein
MRKRTPPTDAGRWPGAGFVKVPTAGVSLRTWGRGQGPNRRESNPHSVPI